MLSSASSCCPPPFAISSSAAFSSNATFFQQNQLCRSLSRGPGGWPGAHAGLLATAPQCIPFEQRLLVFRALVAADKERLVHKTYDQCQNQTNSTLSMEGLSHLTQHHSLRTLPGRRVAHPCKSVRSLSAPAMCFQGSASPAALPFGISLIQDLSCTYLAHHELESVLIIIIIVIIIILLLLLFDPHSQAQPSPLSFCTLLGQPHKPLLLAPLL
jgi:hypothetical protein